MKRQVSRRGILHGVLAGMGVGIGLPVLEMMLSRNGEAFADGSALPRRYGVWFFAGGIHQGWENLPSTALNLTGPFAPLAGYTPKLTFVTGLACPSFGDYGTNRHIMGTAGGLSGYPPKYGAFTGKSID